MLTIAAATSAPVTAKTSWVDYLIIGIYFVVTLGIGFVLRTRMRSSEDFFLAGRSRLKTKLLPNARRLSPHFPSCSSHFWPSLQA
ncbi:MAG TPA: hypothetical protein VF043_29880 [Ktedonobacteraceae bacterium]